MSLPASLKTSQPDSTAARVALWRALHLEVDSKPHIFEDDFGLKLIHPDLNWRQRPDMHPEGTKGYRASIVGRSRFIEDLVSEKLDKGINQYVILGAGLDTFAQRRTEMMSRLRVFEIDQPQTQKWKQYRLMEMDFDIPKNLKFVPIDFEAGESWKEKLIENNFDISKPAVIVSTGVSMYLTKEANKNTLKEIVSFAKGSVFVLTFLLTLDLIDPNEREQHQMVYERAKASGTPFVSFFSPDEIIKISLEAGFKKVKHLSRDDIVGLYFSNRSDGFQPSSGEEYLIATV